ncbi:MAG TPA: tetratricopeptide repeat protein, partial [Candidatus Synoicihabitans sp.]|nr:tetratricopeptide repeat protein [Candidatus Synoicihabitans sp.]
RPWSVFRPSNLVPLVVLGVLFAAAITATAQPARDAYTRGEFRAAEKQWREALAAQPTNWSAHHNLALALAQQQRWAEAAAHALTAFVQQPSQESVRWHFEYTLGRAGYSPPVLGEFTAPDLRHRLAWLFSPSEWQRVLLAAVALAVMAGLLMLMQAYGPRRRGLTLIAALAGVLAFVLAAAAAVSLPRYGPARDPRGVLVWKAVPLRSLPTDVATEQQTTNLAAGSLAIVDQSFLGWRRLVFPNGQTGWVRKEDFVPLWAVN